MKSGEETQRQIRMKDTTLVGEGELTETRWYANSQTRKERLAVKEPIRTRIPSMSLIDWGEDEEVIAQWKDGHWYDAQIVAVNRDGTYRVRYNQDGVETDLTAEQIDARGENPEESDQEEWSG